MRIARTTLALLVLAGAAAPVHAAAAGRVEVSFLEPARYSDAGRDAAESRRNEDTLARHLEGLGQRYLAAGQVLKVDVLDVDLAGTLRPSRRGTGEIRIVRGGADAPHIRVRYALSDSGQVVRSAEETVTDLSYLAHANMPPTDDPLRLEKRMLDDWFKARFVDQKALAG
jgi:hypothetical protein